MKKRLFLSITLVILIFAIPVASQAITLGFDPVTQIVPVGSMVDVELVISGLGDGAAPSLGAFDLDIWFDPAILSFSGYELGPYLGDLDLLEAVDFSLDLIAADTVNISEVSYLDEFDGSGPFFIPPYLEVIQSESFTLATLTFNTLAVGTSSLNISNWVLSDAPGESLDAAVESGSISPVPEPATILLLGAGLAGLAGFRKKFKKS